MRQDLSRPVVHEERWAGTLHGSEAANLMADVIRTKLDLPRYGVTWKLVFRSDQAGELGAIDFEFVQDRDWYLKPDPSAEARDLATEGETA